VRRLVTALHYDLKKTIKEMKVFDKESIELLQTIEGLL
jgi:hypothetical protein